MRKIDTCARALTALGIRMGDRVTLAFPNCPQAVYAFYALNRIGAVANMVHPLSAPAEIEFFLNVSHSLLVITLDRLYNTFEPIIQNSDVAGMVLVSLQDEFPPHVRVGYALTEGRKVPKVPADARAIRWKSLMAPAADLAAPAADPAAPAPVPAAAHAASGDVAAIMYSGGTTGTTKGIELTNANFNALAAQLLAVVPTLQPGDKAMAVAPIFHGYGLGVCTTPCSWVAWSACSCRASLPRTSARPWSGTAATSS